MTFVTPSPPARSVTQQRRASSRSVRRHAGCVVASCCGPASHSDFEPSRLEAFSLKASGHLGSPSQASRWRSESGGHERLAWPRGGGHERLAGPRGGGHERLARPRGGGHEVEVTSAELGLEAPRNSSPQPRHCRAGRETESTPAKLRGTNPDESRPRRGHGPRRTPTLGPRALPPGARHESSSFFFPAGAGGKKVSHRDRRNNSELNPAPHRHGGA